MWLSDTGCGEVSFNICYASDFDIAGFQFNFSEVSGGADITLTGASGGDATAYGLTPQIGGSVVLGFSFSGATIPSGCGTLFFIEFDGIATGIDDINISFILLRNIGSKIHSSSRYTEVEMERIIFIDNKTI